MLALIMKQLNLQSHKVNVLEHLVSEAKRGAINNHKVRSKQDSSHNVREPINH